MISDCKFINSSLTKGNPINITREIIILDTNLPAPRSLSVIVSGFTKYTVDYGMGDTVDCIRVITDYGNFGISKTGAVVNC